MCWIMWVKKKIIKKKLIIDKNNENRIISEVTLKIRKMIYLEETISEIMNAEKYLNGTELQKYFNENEYSLITVFLEEKKSIEIKSKIVDKPKLENSPFQSFLQSLSKRFKATGAALLLSINSRLERKYRSILNSLAFFFTSKPTKRM